MAKQAMTVYRDGTLVGESSRLTKPIEVPATAGRYKLTLAADGAPGAQLSTHVETTWSFRSKHVAEDKVEPLPLSGIVFAANLDRSNRAPAGRVFRIPLQVQQFPGSGAAPVKKVTVQASYDDGHTWASVEVDRRHGGLVALVPNQRGNGFVSLRSSLVDQAGNTNDTTVIRAYRN